MILPVVGFNAGSVIVIIIGAPLLYAIFRNSVNRAQLRGQGANRCPHCRSRLKKAPGGTFATVCRKCGR